MVMKSILAAAAVSVLLVGRAFANSGDAVVTDGGDVRINGPGNGLVFPDSSVQYRAAATSLVTQTVYSTQEISFPNGMASPAQLTCVQCPQGTVALGGGGRQVAGGVGFVLMNGSLPSANLSQWCVWWVASLPQPQSQTNNVETWASCLQTSLSPPP